MPRNSLNSVAGARFRSENDERPEIGMVTTRIVAPELGTTFVCVACFQPVGDLHRHQVGSCEEWNALNRIHKGYHRQFSDPTVRPVNQLEPYNILSEHYRLIRDHYGVTARDIMEQAADWGPYNPMRAPLGTYRFWHGYSYDTVLQVLLIQIPPSIREHPRTDPRVYALLRALQNRRSVSHTHEVNKADEKQDLTAVCGFFERHANERNNVVNNPVYSVHNNDFRFTAFWQAKYGPPIPNANSAWLEMSGPNDGVARVGNQGIRDSVRQFAFFAAPNNPIVGGRSIQDLDNGIFNVNGTPRR